MFGSVLSDMKEAMRSAFDAQFRVWAGVAIMLAMVAIQYDEIVAPPRSRAFRRPGLGGDRHGPPPHQLHALAFALHPFLTPCFGLAGVVQRGVADLDLAGALVVRDYQAVARDAGTDHLIGVRR
jgi:hypothetical protein